MERDEHRVSLRIRDRRAVVKRRVIVCLPRLHHLKSLLFQSFPHLSGEFHDDFAFLDSAGSARAKVGSTVCRVQHHNA